MHAVKGLKCVDLYLYSPIRLHGLMHTCWIHLPISFGKVVRMHVRLEALTEMAPWNLVYIFLRKFRIYLVTPTHKDRPLP
jgi:hypothetical protein